MTSAHLPAIVYAIEQSSDFANSIGSFAGQVRLCGIGHLRGLLWPTAAGPLWRDRQQETAFVSAAPLGTESQVVKEPVSNYFLVEGALCRRRGLHSRLRCKSPMTVMRMAGRSTGLLPTGDGALS